jgi:hypothetical protein
VGTAHLANLSARCYVRPGTPLIAGGGVTGNGTLGVVARAIGPSLAHFSVPNALHNAPTLSVFTGTTEAANTNGLAVSLSQLSMALGGFPGMQATSEMATGDAGLFGQMSAGTFTIHASVPAGYSGEAMVELYDAGVMHDGDEAHFSNLSARSVIGTDDDRLIVGFVVLGSGHVTILARGAGASLAALGVSDGLNDPQIELYAGSTVIAANDDRDANDVAVRDATAQVGAFPLSSSRDAALLITVGPGVYSLHVRVAGMKNGIQAVPVGSVVAEVYEVR